jgi:hypothetical protein
VGTVGEDGVVIERKTVGDGFVEGVGGRCRRGGRFGRGRGSRSG